MRQLTLELLLPGEHAWNCTCDECEELFEVEMPDWPPTPCAYCGDPYRTNCRELGCGVIGGECLPK